MLIPHWRIDIAIAETLVLRGRTIRTLIVPPHTNSQHSDHQPPR
jgi:hypothetical protein